MHLNWALDNAGTKTKERYESTGKKMLIGDDIGPLNAGPIMDMDTFSKHE